MPLFFVSFSVAAMNWPVSIALSLWKHLSKQKNLLVTNKKIVFRAGTGSCLQRLKCKRNARCVAVTDSFVLINVSSMKARCSPVRFMAATEKETYNNEIIKKPNKRALYVLR